MTQQRNAVRLADYRPPEWLIDSVELEIALDPECTEVRARLSLRRRDGLAEQGQLRLDAEALELLAIRLDGQPLDPQACSDGPAHCRVPVHAASHVLETRSRLRPSANTRLEGLYCSGELMLTQCEAEGFRRITPFLDRPDVMARYRVTMTADAARFPVLLANGNPAGSGVLEDGRHWACWDDPHPKPSYLFAIAAGPLHCIERSLTTAEQRPVVLRLWSDQQLLPRLHYAMEALQRALRWDEQHYGRCYDLDVFNVVAARDFNMGAMENKGLNIFNARYLAADQDSATDSDFQHVDAVVAHEYFHNWTGNRVTCRDWFQLSLKEGLTVFRDQCYTASRQGEALKRIEDVRMLRNVQFTEDSGPLAHPVRPASYEEINNFYTATVYEKGAEVVRMLHTLLGPALFRQGTDLYFQRHDGQAVTVEDFLACMAEVSGRDLAAFMNWYTQAGTPRLRVARHYNAEQGTLVLELIQSSAPGSDGRPRQPLPIPLRLGLLDQDGNALPLRMQGDKDEDPAPLERVHVLDAEREHLVFTGLSSEPVPSLLRGFSAPVLLSVDLTRSELALLAAHDSDAFNRWEAAQRLLEQQILACMDAELGGRSCPLPAETLASLTRLLEEPELSPAWLAETLTLPDEAWLAESLAQIDVDALWQARESTRKALAQSLEAAMQQRLAALGEPEPWSPEPEAMGRRRLRNLLRGYRLAAGDAGMAGQLWQQFQRSDNMSDRLAALRLLVHARSEHAAAALAEFEQRFGDDALTLDKWFEVQASRPGADGIELLNALLAHPAFSLRNPNRVRAVLGSFVRGNRVGFHRADGAGYRLLAEHLEELDALNPQVAARLATAFQDWRRYDPRRQRLMVAELERLRSLPELSPDLAEIIARALSA